jgi:selenocysteine lyase/cysteine desulfurase
MLAERFIAFLKGENSDDFISFRHERDCGVPVHARDGVSGHHMYYKCSDEDLKKPSLRISFSHYNSNEDIDLL